MTYEPPAPNDPWKGTQSSGHGAEQQASAPNTDPYAAPGDQEAPNAQTPPNGQTPPNAQNGPSASFAVPGVPTDNERLWATLAHLSALVGILVSAGYLGWLVPLVLFLVYKDSSPFIRQAAAGALNFAIMLLVGSVVASALVGIGLMLSLLVVPLLLVVLGGILWVVLLGLGIVVPILAAMTANKGEPYTYPLTPAIVR